MGEDENNKQDRVKNYLKFTTLAIQMGALITAAALGGDWLDENQNNEFPVWTLVLTLIAIFASLFQVIREVSKMNQDD